MKGRLHKHSEALSCLYAAHRGYDVARHTMDPEDALTVINDVACGMGTVLTNLERFDEAETYFTGALAAGRAINGTDGGSELLMRTNLAFVWLRQGRVEEAMLRTARF